MKPVVTSALVALAVSYGFSASQKPEYKITQEYRSSYAADRFYIYKRIGPFPFYFYYLDLPSYGSLPAAQAAAQARLSGKERTVGYVP